MTLSLRVLPAVAACAATFASFATATAQAQEEATARSSDASEHAKVPAPQGMLQHFAPFTDRWYAPGYTPEGIDLTGYSINEIGGRWWSPYTQNPIKGDFPIFGTQGLFLNVGGLVRQFSEIRDIPTPTANTGSGGQNFFGDGKQQTHLTQVALTLDLFSAPQAFEPVHWRLKATPVVQRTQVRVEPDGVLFADPSEGNNRVDEDFALQELLFEYHLADLSNRFDFISFEGGIIPFRSDFRGFMFDDVNLGVRLFGNLDSNRWQYNLAFFDMLDKDTNSGLNKFESRQQEVVIANLYRQDWPVLGFNTQASFHYNNDTRGLEFDDNGILVSPAPIGQAKENKVESYYFGLAGDGHFDRWNVTTAFYQAMGRDSLNPLAAREVDIDSQFGALELSYDFDWFRVRGFSQYATGDPDTRDGDAEGFDAIFDAPNFAGGPLSFFNGQAIRLLGVNLTNLGSGLPDLQSSQTQGKSNFVNPGLFQLGGAVDFELTPKWRAVVGGSYLRFNETDPLEVYLQLPEVEKEIGVEYFFGTQYRPRLDNHVILQVGASSLIPGAGFARIFQSDDPVYALNCNLIFAF